jgi:hypothetical protein
MKELWAKSQVRMWLAIVGSATLILGACYVMVQQSTRLSANDLPIITAQSLQDKLGQGASPSDVVPAQKVIPRGNYGVFVTIVDWDRYIQATNLNVDNKTPLPPKGVFDYTAKHGNDTITWQPTSDVRLATHVEAYSDSHAASHPSGFIITGQSLKPYEDRTNTYTALAAAAWVAVIGWATLTLIIPAQKK